MRDQSSSVHSALSCAVQVATYREQKKAADKQRKLAEKAHRIKEESLRDDDNVFDVAFENQGLEGAEGAVSATDIKVCCILMRGLQDLVMRACKVKSYCSPGCLFDWLM